MAHDLRIGKWIGAALVSLLAIWGWVYLVVHVILGVATRSILSPGLAVTGVTFALAPLIMVARRYDASHGNRRAVSLTLLGYLLALSLIFGHYAVVFRLIGSRDYFGASVMTILIYAMAAAVLVIRRSVRKNAASKPQKG
jgi:hypothetical protein